VVATECSLTGDEFECHVNSMSLNDRRWCETVGGVQDALLWVMRYAAELSWFDEHIQLPGNVHAPCFEPK